MADDILLNAGSGGATLAADDVTGKHYQRVKLTDGTADSATTIDAGNGTAANALRVTVASDSTGQVKIAAGAASIGTLGANDGVDIGDVTLNNSSIAVTSASALDVSAATVTVDSELTTADLDTGAGTDTRAVVGVALAESGGGILVGSANPMPVDGSGVTQPVSGTVTANLSATDNAVLDQLELNTSYGDNTGGGTETGALRVTLANNSTGLVSVDDNGGAITVDAPNDGSLVTQIGDGTSLATVRNLASNDALNVAIVDGAGAQITTFGGGTQYTEADVDATITGTALMMEDAANTLRAATGDTTNGLDVDVTRVSGTVTVDGSGVTQPVSGTITANAGTGTFTVDGSGVTQPVSGTVTANAGTGTFTVGNTNIDNLHSEDYDTGAGTDTTSAIGIAVPAAGGAVVVPGDATAGLKVNLGVDNDVTVSGTVTVTDDGSFTLAANSGVDIGDVDVISVTPGTAAGNLGKAEDAAHTTGDVGVMALAVQQTADTALAGTTGDYAPLQVDDTGYLKVNIKAGSASGTEYTEDDAAVANPAGSQPVMVRQDTPATLVSADGDVVAQRATNYGAAFVQVLDSSGNFINSFGGSGGTSHADDAAFSIGGASSITPVGFLADETTPDSVDEGDVGVARMTLNRKAYAVLADPTAENSAGVDASGHLQVDIAADSVGIGGGTQYTEDDVAAANPVGNQPVLVRQDTPASEVSANGDVIAQRATQYGAGYVQIVSSTGSFVDSFGGGTQYTEGGTDATITGTALMFEDAADTLRAATGDLTNGLDVDVTRVSGTVTVGNGGTFAVQEDGAALTALQKLDNIAHSGADVALSEHVPISGQLDDVAPTSVTENQVAPVRITSGRALHVAQQGTATVTDDGSFTLAANDGVDIGDVTLNNASIAVTSAAALDVSAATVTVSGTVTANAGTGDYLSVSAHTRNEAFKESTAIGGELDDTAPVAATEGNVSPARITAQRALHANLRNNAGTEIGTTANPIAVTDDGNAILVDGSATTQPISGTVTANAGTGTFTVDGSGVTQPVSGTVTANAGTGAFNNDSVAAEAAALGSGVLIQGDDGTDRKNINVDATTGDVQVDVTNTVTVGSHDVTNAGTFAVQAAVDELPAAAALTDNFANPTTTQVGAMSMVWDGANWDRVPGNQTDGVTVNLGANNDISLNGGTNLIGFVTPSGSTAGGSTLYKNIDVDETEDQIKGTAGTLYWLHAMNLGSATRFLKLYNATAATVTVGTTTPDLTFPLPTQGDSNGAGFTISFPTGVAFGTALTIAATTGVADADAGAPGANEVIVNLGYT